MNYYTEKVSKDNTFTNSEAWHSVLLEASKRQNNIMAKSQDEFKDSIEVVAKHHFQQAKDTLMRGKDSEATGQLYFFLKREQQAIIPEYQEILPYGTVLLQLLSVNNFGSGLPEMIKKNVNWEGQHSQVDLSLRGRDPIANIKPVAGSNTLYNTSFLATSRITSADFRLAARNNVNYADYLTRGHYRSASQTQELINTLGIDEGQAGIANNPFVNINLTSVIDWKTEDGRKIYNDILALWATIVGKLRAREDMKPTLLLIPSEWFPYVDKTYSELGDPANVSLTPFTVRSALELNLKILVAPSAFLNTASQTGGPRAVMFNNNPSFVEFFLSDPLEFSPIFIQKFVQEYDTKFTTAGAWVSNTVPIGYISDF